MTDKEGRSEGPITASVERLRTELDRWLDAAMTQGGKALDVMGLRNSEKPWVPHIDLVESPDDVKVYVSLPGTDPQSVDVTIAGNMLTIKGETPTGLVGVSPLIVSMLPAIVTSTDCGSVPGRLT